MTLPKTVQAHWQKKELLGIDAVLFGDGKVIPLNFYALVPGVSHSPDQIKYFVNPICDTTIESIEKYNPPVWVEITEMVPVLKLANEQTITYGEGCMGNEGFIALQDKNEQLIWALFSTKSNPFFQVDFSEHSTICAYTTSDLIYTFDIVHPEIIKITQNLKRKFS